MAEDNLSKKTKHMVCEDFDLNKNFTEDFEKYCDSDESLGILSLNFSDSSEDDLLFDKNKSAGGSNQLHYDHVLTEEYNIPFSKHYSVQNFFTKLHPIKEDEQVSKLTNSFSEQVHEKVCNLFEEQRYFSTTTTFQNTSELNKFKNENDFIKSSPTCNISKFQCVNSENPFQSMYCSTPKHNSSYTFNLDEYLSYEKEHLPVSPLSKTICKTETVFAQSGKLEDCVNILSNRTAILTSETCEGDSNKNMLSATHNFEIPLDINDSKLNKTFNVITQTDNLQLEGKNKTFNLKKMGETHVIKFLVADGERMYENNKTIKNNSSNIKYLPENCKERMNFETKVSASSQDVTNVTYVLNETVTMVTENENFNLDKTHMPHEAEILKCDKNIKNSFLNFKTPISQDVTMVTENENFNLDKKHVPHEAKILKYDKNIKNSFLNSETSISQDVTNVACNVLNETVTIVTENENFNLDKKHVPHEAKILKYDKNIKNSFLNSETSISQDVTNVACNVLNETVTIVTENENFNLDKKQVPHEAEILKYDKNIDNSSLNVKYHPENCKEGMKSETPISASSLDGTNVTCNVLNETVTIVTENENFNLDKKQVPHEAEILKYDTNIDNSSLNVKYHPENCKEGMNSETPISASSLDVTNVTCNVLNETVTMVKENESFNLDKKHLPHEAKVMKYDKNFQGNFSNMKYLPKNSKEWMKSGIPVSASSQDWANVTCNVLNETVTMVAENKHFNLDKKYVSHEAEIENITNEIDASGELSKIEKPSKFQKQIKNMKMSKIARISNISSSASNNKFSEFDKKKTRKSINVMNKNFPSSQSQNRNAAFGSAMNDNIAGNQSPVVQKYLSCTTTDSRTVMNASPIPKKSLLKEEINIRPVENKNFGICRRNVTNNNSPLVSEVSSRKTKFSLEKKQDFSLHKTTNLMNAANCAAKILKENISSPKQDFLPKKCNGLQNPSTEQLRYSKKASISKTGTKEKTFLARGVQEKRLSFQSGLNSGPSSLTVKNLEGKSSMPEKSTMKKTESKKNFQIKNPFGNLR